MGDTFGSGAKPIYYGSDTVDPDSLVNWTTTEEEVDCTGAEVGMLVSVGMTTFDGTVAGQNYLHLNGYVKDGGDVVVVVFSNMGSVIPLNLAEGTLYVKATFG